MRAVQLVSCCSLMLLIGGQANADASPERFAGAPTTANVPEGDGECRTPSPANLVLGGYIETYWAWNFARPANSITYNRFPDNRHNSFTLGNAVLDGAFSVDRVTGRIALQSGSVPYTQYATTEARRDTQGANPSDGSAWRFLQQATVGYRTSQHAGLLLEAGLMLSPIGPEGVAVHEQWNWSRSNLFYALPMQQTGVRATYPVSTNLSVQASVFNGWYGVRDNNGDKSVGAALVYRLPQRLTTSLRYLGGVERDAKAPEGRPWRHLVDAYILLWPSQRVALLLQGDAGFEMTRFGLSSWVGGALYARVQPARRLYLSIRADGYRQLVAHNSAGAADPMLFAAQGVVSGTATVDVRPQDHLSVRLEYRHDQGATPLYFRGEVLGSGSASNPYEPNSHSQDTILLGATAWF
ncbi:MAG: porin [Deltaproteobacteria bacterium]|nr:porin [Deltaproteobacteria bacterium]